MKARPYQVLLATVASCVLALPAADTAETRLDPSAAPGEMPEAAGEEAASEKTDEKKKKKGSNKKKGGKKDGDGKNDGDGKAKPDAKDAAVTPPPKPDQAANGDWCVWLADRPGTLYDDKTNPWLQSFRIAGRFQYQVAYQDGEDMKGREYHDTYDEYRRFRIETRTKFLGSLSAELDVNLVDDNRYKRPPGNDLDWGYDSFDTATLECNLLKAFDTAVLDDLKIAYGKMKMPVTEEQRQSSREIYTIERSLLSNKLVGEESRPTGVLLEAAKAEWSGRIGFFSGEDDADFIGAWNDGVTQFYSLTWQPDGDFNLTLDYVTTHRSGTDDALGYRSAVVLGSTYEKRYGGLQTSLVYGDNGYGDPTDSVRNRASRQGDFYGVTVMPWYWLVKDRLQLVCRYEYAQSEEDQGLQLTSRYIRARHDDPMVNVNNGRGDHYNAWYLGLNYYLCGDNAKIMGGILYEDMAVSDNVKIDRPKKRGGDYYITDRGTLKAFTYMIGFRTAF